MAGRPNAVLNSPYRKEIEEFLRENKPLTFIEKWLKDQGSPISRPTLTKYKKEDFNISLEAQRKYNEKQSKQRLDEASDEQVDDIELIDEILSNVDPKIIIKMLPKDQIQSVAKLLNTKYKILGVIDDGETDVNININNNEPKKFNDILKTRVEKAKTDKDVN